MYLQLLEKFTEVLKHDHNMAMPLIYLAGMCHLTERVRNAFWFICHGNITPNFEVRFSESSKIDRKTTQQRQYVTDYNEGYGI
jgi:hypothetical protein